MVKSYQKAAALLLALALIFALPVPASAAETTEARVPVTLTVVNTVSSDFVYGSGLSARVAGGRLCSLRQQCRNHQHWQDRRNSCDQGRCSGGHV